MAEGLERRVKDGVLQLVFLSHAASTLFMVGLILFVQVAHCSLLAAADRAESSE